MSRRARTAAVLILLALGMGAQAKEETAGKDPAAAIRAAFGWLDRHLDSLPDVKGTPRKPFTLATAGLDYLMAERSGRSGTTTDPIPGIREKLLTYLAEVEKRVRDPGELPTAYGVADSRKLVQYTWPLAQSALFFTELALDGRWEKESRGAVRRIVAILEDSQDDNGGWGHGRIDPKPSKDEDDPFGGRMKQTGAGYPSTLLAATNTVASALGIVEAALGPGMVDGLDAARKYYRDARLDNGNFPYDPSQRSSGSALSGVGRTGGALLAMHCLGFKRDDPDVAGSLAFLLDHLDYAGEGHGSPMLNLAQSALGLYLTDGKAWERFRKLYFPRIIDHQTDDGDLTCTCGKKAFGTTCDSEGPGAGIAIFRDGQKAYTTSLELFVLLLDRGRLKMLTKAPKTVPAKSRNVPTKGREKAK